MSEQQAPVGFKPPHPFLYFLLFLPFGATSGFITVTIGFLAGKAGIPDGVIAGLVAMNTLPHTWKFIWAPLVDTIWTSRGWYITSNLLSSAAIISIGFIPITEGTVALITGIIFINGLSTTFVGMCTESLMARLTPPEGRGAAGGWSQAGNVGGSVVGSLGLLLAENTSYDWLPSLAVGSTLMGCSLALAFVKEPPRTEPRPKFKDSILALGKDIHGLLIDRNRARRLPSKWLIPFPPVFFYVLSAAGILSIALCLVPIGSGGAANLFSAMSKEWGAGATLVTIIGIAGGVAAILGSLAGGYLATKVDKRKAYAISGVVLALFTFAMAAAPQNRVAYSAGVFAYNFALGMCYATFTAFVLDIIGHTGGATKYNLFASLANMPIYAMGLLDGWIATKYDRTTMLWVDGLSGIVGAVILMGVVFVLRSRTPSAPPKEAAPLPTAKIHDGDG